MASLVGLLRTAGLFACFVGVVAVNLLTDFPLTLDLGGWTGGVSALVFASTIASATFAFRSAVYGRSHPPQHSV
jgi:hypothetical protein